MEDEGFVPLKRKLQELVSDANRIEYLESYLREHSGVSLGLLATIYEWLGVLHYQEGRPRGGFFKKAASTWEMIAVLEEGSKNYSDQFRKGAFKEAMKNYKKAKKMYARADSSASAEEMDLKISLVRDELRKYGGPTKALGLIFIGVVFLAAIFLLSGPPTTGMVASPLGDNETTATGIFLAILGVVGVVFVLWKWR
ncbi:MAG: hypothetical protein DRP08_02665 [Candidatus Aenigmatarchaeota archaeon]|nr:MAG: hypothetical protein DRP08_02665 [Candidatus Aenigmarchaeota archaeon]